MKAEVSTQVVRSRLMLTLGKIYFPENKRANSFNKINEINCENMFLPVSLISLSPVLNEKIINHLINDVNVLHQNHDAQYLKRYSFSFSLCMTRKI